MFSSLLPHCVFSHPGPLSGPCNLLFRLSNGHPRARPSPRGHLNPNAPYLAALNPLPTTAASLRRINTRIRISRKTAPDPIQVGDHVITQKSLYTGLFVISIPLLWVSSPFSTFFWLVGASAILILGHAMIMEPGIESEYAQVQDSV